MKGGEFMSRLASSIKALRKQQHMTQDELAELLHVTRQTVSNYENGKSEPDIETLVRIAEIFETDVNSLVNSPNPKSEATQPKHWGKAVGLVAVTVLCFYGIGILKDIAYEYAKAHYIGVYSYALVTFCYPFSFSLLGYSIIFLLKQFAHFPTPKAWYRPVHNTLIVILSMNLMLYLPQVLWCAMDLLRLAGVQSIGKLTPLDTLWPYWHMAAILYYPQLCYTLYALCGGGIAITNVKTPKD